MKIVLLVAAVIGSALACGPTSEVKPGEPVPVLDPYFPIDCIGAECGGAGGESGATN